MNSKNCLLILAVLLIFLLLLGCQSVEPTAPLGPETRSPLPSATSLPDPTATATAVPSPIPFVPTFNESACFFEVPDGVVVGEDLTCGFVTVLEDHNLPDGPTIKIAIVIIKDKSQDHQPDPVFVLAGGPGQKLLQDTIPIAPILQPVHPGRDLVLFDQRGVGFSQPALECPGLPAAYLANINESDLERRAETSFTAIMACRDELVAAGHNLAAYTTWQNAADVEVIRQALGYDEYNLYGGSYGSQLAQAVMRDYPDPIRSVVIDSVYPLEASFFVDVSTVSSAAIMHLLESCAADAACQAAYPDLEGTLFRLIDQLNAEPLPVTLTHPLTGETVDALLTGDEIGGNLRTFLYETMAIPLLPQAIGAMAEEDYSLMIRLSSAKLALLERLSQGMEFSVICSDDLIGRTPQDFLDNLAALPPQLAGQMDLELINEFGIFAVCEAWPVTEMEPWVKEPVVSDIPTLILSGEFDPVTPSEYADQAAAHLSHSYVYEYSGVAHSPIGGSACARQMVKAFIEDPQTAPDDSCMAGLGVDFAVPEDYDLHNREAVFIEGIGASSVVPAGWSEIEPGVFASPDLTEFLYIIVVDSELDTFIADNKLTGPGDEFEINGRLWQAYEFQPAKTENIGLDVITPRAEGGFYDIALITPRDQREEMEKEVLMPAIMAFNEGEAPIQPEPETAPALVPFTSDSFGISGLQPEGWEEAGPGIYTRQAAAGDLTTLIQKSYRGASTAELLGALLPQLGLEALPGVSERLETAALTWDIYKIDMVLPTGETIIVDIALTEVDGVPYMVLLQTPAADYEVLHDTVFLPAVGNFTPTE